MRIYSTHGECLCFLANMILESIVDVSSIVSMIVLNVYAQLLGFSFKVLFASIVLELDKEDCK